MHEYEICILKGGVPSIISLEIQLSDHAAIRSAQRLAQGNKFQVWRDGDCIYGLDSKPAFSSPLDARP